MIYVCAHAISPCASRGRSRAEFIAKCGDSLRELEETSYWLELLVEGKMVAGEKLVALRQECDELIAIFVTIIRKSREPQKSGSPEVSS